MALSERDGEDALHAHVRALQKEIGIDEHFLENLFKESDDWSFVVKLNALIEGALTHLLADVLKKPELRDVFAHTDLAGLRSGKVAFASALGLMESEDRRLILKLAEMRNAFVHDVRRVNLTIPDYLKSLDDGDRKGLLKAIRYFGADQQVMDLPKVGMVSIGKFVEENPKLAIWFSAMNLIAVLYVHRETSELKRKIEDLQSINKAYLSATMGGPPAPPQPGASTPADGGPSDS